MSLRIADILMVEDNAADVCLTKEAFREHGSAHILHVVNDGVEALEFLHGEGRFAQAPTPDIVLLDLNLPRKNGHEVLAVIKSDPLLRKIPVIVLTTSKAERDIVLSYDLHANCHIVKPLDVSDYIGVVQCVERFWLSLISLAPRASRG
jgi:two-component system, chemotaxis family, response regulator Rcp1